MSTSSLTDDQLPEAEVREQRWPSPVWLIPLAALLIGLWLLFQLWYQRGPTIVVQFTSAEGIEAGKTEVRYKAVPVGKVKKLGLSDDLKYIEASIEVSKSMGHHLGSDARFWVVRPRINRSGVSGLTTLFSGTYIGMDPGTNTDDLSTYQGEERPPVITPAENGRRFYLMSDSLGSMDVGAPVFYKQLQVGEVIDYKLLPDLDQVKLEIFIRDPYYDFVHTNSRFWNASGAEFKLGTSGVDFRMESLTSLLVGGVAFDTPKAIAAGDVSKEGSEFLLYPSFGVSQEKSYNLKLYYVMYFDNSLRGLAVGAPVEYQGFPVGKVENIDMTMDPHSLKVRVPVLVSIQPQKFNESLNKDQAEAAMKQLVSQGLRAKLDTASLLTGQKVISLSMEKNPPAADIKVTQFYSEFPTTNSGGIDDLPKKAGEVMESLQATLDGVKKLVNSGKLDTTVNNLNKVLAEAELAVKQAKETLHSADAVIQTANKQTLPGVSKDVDKITNDLSLTLRKVQNSLGHIDRITAQNSPTQYQLQEMLEEVTSASRSVRSLAETLQRQPQSLIKGKQGDSE